MPRFFPVSMICAWVALASLQAAEAVKPALPEPLPDMTGQPEALVPEEIPPPIKLPDGEPQEGGVTDDKVAQCEKNIRSLALAAIEFARKHQGNLPANIELLGMLGLKSRTPIKCPFDPGQKSWGYEIRLRGVLLSGISNAAKTPLLAARYPGPDGKRWVAFADGHTERLDRVPVVRILAAAKPPKESTRGRKK